MPTTGVKHHSGTDRHFWEVTVPLSHSDARDRCQLDGGDLATVDTQELLDFVWDEYG